VGRRFIELLSRKAREGVHVRVLYDWFGCGFGPAFGLFEPLVAAGAEVRAFNPPALNAALGWLRRNHRKLITVDGTTAFVSGLCVGQEWLGDPARHRAPWRDTGVEIVGPGAVEAERVFVESWGFAGGAIPADELPPADPPAGDGPVSLRIIPTRPFGWRLFQLDLLVTTLAKRRLWITDAYFLGHGPFVEALRRAAQDGVDVRLLLPQGSDVGWTVPASRTLYRTMLESGIRIFEWNGPMIHAKTAVADSHWGRIGSTNLNLASWLGNWELDVSIEDRDIACTLEAHYEEDLTHATEVVLGRKLIHPGLPMTPRARARRSARRVMHTVSGLGRSIGAAVTGNRQLEAFEFAPLFTFGAALIGVAAVGLAAPWLLAWPIALLAAWAGTTLGLEALSLWRKRTRP
jgi:phosphatidylserine/phosphatidylglycerophosphate/cardiolipin synthase-like enzyme